MTGVRYGLEDESARINLRTLLKWTSDKGNAKKMLMALPGMTDEIADAILDWIDEDRHAPGERGRVEYYSALTPAYAPRNGPPATIEELLLVRGVTPQLLFGLDAARMSRQRRGRGDGRPRRRVDNSDGSMDHGWAAYLTLCTVPSRTSAPTARAKINLNGTDLQKLYTDLQQVFTAEEATFIIAYRQNGCPRRRPPRPATGRPRHWSLDFTKPATTASKACST